jgi:hypothetical protein
MELSHRRPLHWYRTRPVFLWMLYMPNKLNADRRDKIPKQKRRVTN